MASPPVCRPHPSRVDEHFTAQHSRSGAQTDKLSARCGAGGRLLFHEAAEPPAQGVDTSAGESTHENLARQALSPGSYLGWRGR
jgi:hypothetical protein